MRGIDPLAAGAALPTSLRTTSEVLDELYFKPPIHLGDGVVSGAILPGTQQVPVIEFPATGGTTAWRWTHRMRPGWARAGVTVDLEYASPVGAATDFVVMVAIRVISPGDVLGGLVNRASANLTLPAHAVAGTVQATRRVFAAPILPTAASEVSLTIARLDANPADNDPNSLYVTSLRIEFTTRGA